MEIGGRPVGRPADTLPGGPSDSGYGGDVPSGVASRRPAVGVADRRCEGGHERGCPATQPTAGATDRRRARASGWHMPASPGRAARSCHRATLVVERGTPRARTIRRGRASTGSERAGDEPPRPLVRRLGQTTPCRSRPIHKSGAGSGVRPAPTPGRASAPGRGTEGGPTGGVPRTASKGRPSVRVRTRTLATGGCPTVERRSTCPKLGGATSTRACQTVNVRPNAPEPQGELIRSDGGGAAAGRREPGGGAAAGRPAAQVGRRKTYPTPRTVWMKAGSPTSASIAVRSQCTWTSTVRVSPA